MNITLNVQIEVDNTHLELLRGLWHVVIPLLIEFILWYVFNIYCCWRRPSWSFEILCFSTFTWPGPVNRKVKVYSNFEPIMLTVLILCSNFGNSCSLTLKLKFYSKFMVELIRAYTIQYTMAWKNTKIEGLSKKSFSSSEWIQL